MEERLKIAEMLARLEKRVGLERKQTDKVPIALEEDYVLNEIAKVHQISTRAGTWRWLLARYGDFELSERLVTAFRNKQRNDAEIEALLGEVQ
jgi:hypothetical protein